MNGQNRNRKSIDDIINASDLAELLSDSLQIRRRGGEKGYISIEDRDWEDDYIGYLEKRGLEDTDKNKVMYYLSKTIGDKKDPWRDYSTDPESGEKEVHAMRLYSMFGDRIREARRKGKPLKMDPENPETIDAFDLKRLLNRFGHDFDELSPSYRDKFIKRAEAFDEEETKSINNFLASVVEDEETNPMNPNYRTPYNLAPVEMPNVETESAQAPSLADLLKVSLSKMFRR